MILTIGPGGCGFSFLNWSISYLRGDSYYYKLNGTQVQVDIDPIDDITAHNFAKDHLIPSDDWSILNLANNQSIIYMVPGNNDEFKSLLTYPSKKIIFNNAKFCKEQFARNYLTVPDNHFNKLTNELSDRYNLSDIKKVLLDLSPRWFGSYYTIPTDANCFIIDYYDMFDNLSSKIIEIFNFLNIDLDQNRYTNWQDTYQNYKMLNNDILKNYVASIDKIAINDSTKILKEIINWKNGLYLHT